MSDTKESFEEWWKVQSPSGYRQTSQEEHAKAAWNHLMAIIDRQRDTITTLTRQVMEAQLTDKDALLQQYETSYEDLKDRCLELEELMREKDAELERLTRVLANIAVGSTPWIDGYSGSVYDLLSKYAELALDGKEPYLKPEEKP